MGSVMSDLRVLGKEHGQESSWNNFFLKLCLTSYFLLARREGEIKICIATEM